MVEDGHFNKMFYKIKHNDGGSLSTVQDLFSAFKKGDVLFYDFFWPPTWIISILKLVSAGEHVPGLVPSKG